MALKKVELLKRKAELAAEVRKQGDAYNARLAANQTAWPDETRSAWDKVNADYDANEKELNALTEQETIARRMEQIRKDVENTTRSGDRPGMDDVMPGEGRTFGDAGMTREEAAKYSVRERHKRNALAAWAIYPTSPRSITDEMRESCEELKFSPQENSIQFDPANTERVKAIQSQMRTLTRSEREAVLAGDSTFLEKRLSGVTATQGLELVPQTFVNMMEVAILSVGPFMQLVDTITTAAGEDMLWPTADDTANESVFVTTESEDQIAVSGTPDPVFNRQTWGAHETHSRWIRLPWRLDQDAIVNMGSTLAMLIGQRFGRGFNTVCTTGNAAGRPQGIVTGAPIGVTAALATSISFDDLIKLEHSVDPAVRSESTYMCNDALIQAFRLIKDTEGRYIWQPSLSELAADRINGRPYAYNQAMQGTIATATDTVIFGRLTDYKFRRAGNIKLVRAVERFAERAQDGFLGYWRCDGKLLRPTADARVTVKKLRQA